MSIPVSESPRDAWQRRLRDSKAKLADNVDAGMLADEFGALDDEIVENVCEAENADNYTPINGASDLVPVNSISFEVGDECHAQSHLRMDLSKATGSEVRQNLTTESIVGRGK